MVAPLDDCLIVDFTTLLPGPLATLMLARAGAEVVKVERPQGEDMRRIGPFVDGQSLPFALLNRGKKTIALDLKTPAGREALKPLLARADIVVEQFRPGVMDRLGLGFEALSALNPRLIYCSITGYGASGPMAGKAGHDLNYIAESGLLALSHGPLATPVLPPAQIADIAGGSFPAVINLLLALIERQRSGQGRRLDISMTQSLFSLMPFALADYAAFGITPASGKAMLSGGLARYNVYPAKDGRLIAIGALEEPFWQAVCDSCGLEAEFRDDYAKPERSHRRLAEIIAGADSVEWAKCFAGKDTCVSIVSTLAEALENPQFSALFYGKQPVEALLPLPLDANLSSTIAAEIPAIGAHNHLYLAADL